MKPASRPILAIVAGLLPALSVADIGPALTGLAAGGNDATTVFFSPAAMTRLDHEVVVQTAVVYQDAKFSVDSASLDGGSADSDESVFLIPGGYYVRPLGERWRLGLSLSVPSGIGHDYGVSWAGRYLAEESSLAFVAISAPLAYRINDQWSVAAGPLVIYTDSVSTARVNNILPEYGDGRVKLEEDGAGIGWSAGVMFELSPETRFGFSYKSEIDPDLKGTPSFRNVDPVLREILAAADLLGTEINVDFTVPAIAQAGFYTELSDTWALTGDAIWIDMSEFGVTHVRVEETGIHVRSQGFKDNWVGSVGLEYKYSEDRTLSFGALYMSSPIDDEDRQITLPFDRIWGVGAGLEQACWGHECKFSLNYFDLGDGEVTEDLGPLGAIEGSFSTNWAVMLDFQLRIKL